MKLPHFPKPISFAHPPIKNLNEVFEERLTFGQRASDSVARIVGSWRFIILQTLLLIAWVVLNAVAWFSHWDPYPFILMNLFLSMQAAFTAPIIMMSQNRQAARDRLEAHMDFEIDKKAEAGVQAILEHLAAQNAALTEIHQTLAALQAQVDALSKDETSGGET